MEFSFTTSKNDSRNKFAALKLKKNEPCELTVKMNLEDVLELLKSHELFQKFNTKIMSPVRYRMESKQGSIELTIYGDVQSKQRCKICGMPTIPESELCFKHMVINVPKPE